MSKPRVPRTDRATTIWMCAVAVAAAVTIVARGRIPQNLWTMIHLVTLGVLSNGIFQWSWYFTRALAHLAPDDRRAGRDNTVRIIAFNLSLLLLIGGMWSGLWYATVTGASIVGTIAAWHGWALLTTSRERLASRFAVIIRYYVAAAFFLVVGATLAGFVTAAMFDADAPAWLAEARDRLTVAHALAGIAGWVGLTMGGTLVTLGPTAMRTRMDPRAVSFATSALPMWVAALLVAGTGAVTGSMRVTSVGLLVVVGAAALGVGVPLVRAALTKGPAEYGAWSLMLGAAWILVAGAGASLRAFGAADATGLRSAFLAWMPILGAAGLGQLFVGALTYLMPVVIGGGPSAVRVGVGVLEAAAPIREAARNVAAILALAVASLSGTSAERLTIAAWVVLLATYVVDIVLMARCGVAQARAKRTAASSPTTQGGRRG